MQRCPSPKCKIHFDKSEFCSAVSPCLFMKINNGVDAMNLGAAAISQPVKKIMAMSSSF